MIIDYPKPEHRSQLWALWKQAFGDEDAFLEAFFSTAYSSQRCLCAMHRGVVAGALYWFDCQWEDKRLAYLYAVATEKGFRGQGVCRTLMEGTHSRLKQLGYDGCVLVPCSAELFAMYEKLGYTTCGYIRQFSCDKGEAVPVRQLTAAQYAQLRRQYLPAGGVIQEGQTLRFLQTQGGFYRTENGVLACAPYQDRLVITEFLGDTSVAPGVLGALGYDRGTVRTPGGDMPFAMYHPLTDHTHRPAYFGLALD